MSKEDFRSFSSRRRIILHMIEKYLNENGFSDIGSVLRTEALLQGHEVCDNVDLDSLFLEYCSYHNLKFGKFPKFLRKTEQKIDSARSEKKKMVLKPKKTSKNSAYEGPEFVSELQIRQVFQSDESPKEQLIPIEGAKNYDIPPEWSDLAEIVHRTLSTNDYGLRWKDVIGNAQAINTINEAIFLPMKHPELFSGSLKPWKSALLHGPPGCGKTLIAKTLCSEISGSVAFFNISPSTIMSKWRGESEKLINIVFKIAKSHAPAIIFIDEIESLTSRRDDPLEHEASKRFKNEFLSLLDGLETDNDGIFVLATSNLPWIMDEAFLRRFEKKILIQLPNSSERKQLLQLYLPEAKNWEEIVLNNLVEKCNQFTGDEIRIACKEAKMKQLWKVEMGKSSTIKNKNITESDLLDAIDKLKSTAAKSMKKHEDWHNKK